MSDYLAKRSSGSVGGTYPFFLENYSLSFISLIIFLCHAKTDSCTPLGALVKHSIRAVFFYFSIKLYFDKITPIRPLQP